MTAQCEHAVLGLIKCFGAGDAEVIQQAVIQLSLNCAL